MEIEENVKEYHERLIDKRNSIDKIIKSIEDNMRQMEMVPRLENADNQIIIANNKLIELEHQLRDSAICLDDMYTENQEDSVAKIIEYKIRGIVEKNIEILEQLDKKIRNLKISIKNEYGNRCRFYQYLNQDIIEEHVEHIMDKYVDSNNEIMEYSVNKNLVDSIVEYVQENEYSMEEASNLFNNVNKDLETLGGKGKTLELIKKLKTLYVYKNEEINNKAEDINEKEDMIEMG